MVDSPLAIREAVDADLVDLEICCRDPVRLIPNFKELFVDHHHVVTFVALWDRLLVGAVSGTLDQSQNHGFLPAFKLFFLHVAPNFRHRGIGTALFEHMRGFLRKKKIGAVSFSLFQNDKGIPFLEALGFQRRKIERGLIHFELELWESFGVVDEESPEEI